MPLDDLFDDWEPEVRPVEMLLDRTVGSRLAAATREVETAEQKLSQAEEDEKGGMRRPKVAEAKQQLQQAQDRLAQVSELAARKRKTLHLVELGNRRWKELLWLVPPTRQQTERLGDHLDHNPELFPIVAVAFSLVDVKEGDDGELHVVGPAVDQTQLDTLDAALKKAAGDPAKSVKACDEHMPDTVVELNDRLRAGGWERLTAVLFQLNLEVSQVPLSLTGSGRTARS